VAHAAGQAGSHTGGDGKPPRWSPSGRSIVYDHKRGIYRAAARTGAPRKLVRKRANRPAFSPDGKLIAFQDGVDSAYISIFTVDARTGQRPNLIRRGGDPDGDDVFEYFSAVAWQPRP